MEIGDWRLNTTVIVIWFRTWIMWTITRLGRVCVWYAKWRTFQKRLFSKSSVSMEKPCACSVSFVRFTHETLRQSFLSLRSKQVFGASRMGPREGFKNDKAQCANTEPVNFWEVLDEPLSELLMADYATARLALDWRRQYRRFVLSDCGLAVRNPYETLIREG